MSIRKNLGGWKKALGLVLGAGVFLAVGFGIYLLYLLVSLPSVQQIENRQVAQATRIYDRSGEVLLYEISGDERRVLVKLDQIPQRVQDAYLAIEDQDFYSEPAFNWKGIIRAALANLKQGEIVQGASTITQQLARTAFLSTEQTITRKLKELLLAIRLDRHYSKDQILELYLNEVPLGSTFYGISSASSAFFGKPIGELSLGETAVLAAIPKAPTYYSPWGAHTKELFGRQRLVLQKMLELGKISQEEYDAALAEKITFQPQGIGIKAPHFVLAVQDYLTQKYGEEAVRAGGLNVITTLDWDLEQAAEKAVAEGAERNENLYNGKNAALVAQDPKTGQILAMVGSRDYFDIQNEGNFNVATQGLRQPGSALKPFVYLAALAAGYTPRTVVFDVPTEFVSGNPNCPASPDYSTDNSDCFHPQNFDDEFRGPVQFSQALAQSVNIPAVKVLYLVGLKNALQELTDLGITTLGSESRYGLSLVLGGGEVHLADLVGAYSVLAQDGLKHKQTLVLEVKDSKGRVMESYKDQVEPVVDAKYVRAINGILSDVDLRSGLFQSSLSLTVFPGHEVALKTGTTNDYRDAWAMGYTPSLAVGVWAGNNDNTPMQRHGSSILAAVPIWSAFMSEALKDMPTEAFLRPEQFPANKPVLDGQYAVNNQIHSILYYVDKRNPAGPAPADPSNDPQFNNWESGVLNWFVKNPTALIRAGQNQNDSPGVMIFSPSAGAFVSNQINLQAGLAAPQTISKITVYLNNQPVQEFGGPLNNNYYLNANVYLPYLSPQNLLEVEITTTDNHTFKSGVIVYN